MAEEVSVERVIAASPDEVWARVSNIERMGDLSPESAGGTWLKGATGPAVGAKFKGDNENESVSLVMCRSLKCPVVALELSGCRFYAFKPSPA